MSTTKTLKQSCIVRLQNDVFGGTIETAISNDLQKQLSRIEVLTAQIHAMAQTDVVENVIRFSEPASDNHSTLMQLLNLVPDQGTEAPQ
jgi:DNA gyrase/topoisomerase IV subunit A